MAFADGDPLGVRIRCAFGANLATPSSSWVWTDVTEFWHVPDDVTLSWGGSSGATKPETASFGLTFKNTDSRFTAYHPMSPYWPHVREWVPIEWDVDLGDGFGWRNRFSGYVEDWAVRWPGASALMATTRIRAVGELGRLERGRPPARSPMRRTIAAAGPVAYWPGEDGTGAGQVGSAIPGHPPLVVSGTVEFRPVGDYGFVAAETVRTRFGTSALPDLSAGGSLYATLPAAATAATASRWSVHCWADDHPADLSGDLVVMEWTTPGGTYASWRLVITPAGAKRVLGTTSAGVTTTLIDAFAGTGFGTHTVSAEQSGGNIEVILWSTDFIGDSVTVPGTLAGITSIGSNPTAVTSAVQLPIGHLAVFDSVGPPYITRGEGVDAYGGARLFVRGSWMWETVADRLPRLCAEAGIPLTVVGTEDFEDATLSYTITGTWARDSTQAKRGVWSLRSATIGASAQTNAVVTVPAGATTMSLWYMVSSEAGFDFFRILRDGVQVFEASGNTGQWAQRVVDVTGAAQVTFRYIKDGASSAGADAAWVDDLRFEYGAPLRMGPQPPGTLLDLLGECATADQGVLYESGFGLAHLPREHRYNAPVVFTVDAAAGQLGGRFEPVSRDPNRKNMWTVERIDGSSAVAADLALVEVQGEIEGRVRVNHADDSLLGDHAGWWLRRTTPQEPRYPSVPVDLAAHPELAAAWCAVKPGSRVQVVNPPPQNPPGPVDQVVLGAREVWRGRRSWKVAANVEPVSPWTVGTVDGDPRVAADGSTVGVGGLSAGGMSFSLVSTAANGPWTTAGADFPLDVVVGGQVIRLASITGASSPQTANVQTRAVNGIVKAHAAGAPVDVAVPAVVAL